jgi:hypothetical protein
VQRQLAAAFDGEAAQAGDEAIEARAPGLVHGEVAIAEDDGAAATGEPAHRLAAVLEIEEAAVDRERGGRGQTAAEGELQRALVDLGAAGVAVAPVKVTVPPMFLVTPPLPEIVPE